MIDNEFMLQLIEDYLKKHSGKSFPTKEKTALRKLLLDRGDSFFARWKDPKNKNDIGLCIRMTVTSDPGDKTESLRRMKNFASFLQQKGISFDVTWPEIDDIGNRYERILFILRHMQTTDKAVKKSELTASLYLSELLWVSERTIEEDFSYIMPPSDKSVKRSIFQQSLVINGMTRPNGAVHFASTAHPFFLIENLTSLLVLFEALLEKATQLPYQEQAMVTARRIWKQLTPYARDRIATLLKETYPEDQEEIHLFNKMKNTVDKEEENAFIQETTDHEEPVSRLLDAMKFELPCKIEYRADGWKMAEWSGTIKGNWIQNNSVCIEDENLKIPYDYIYAVTLLER